MGVAVTWYGHAAFRLVPEAGPSVILDPYTPELLGYAPITDGADLVITSSDDDQAHCRGDLIAGDPVVVNALGIARRGTERRGQETHAELAIDAIEASEWREHPDRDAPGANAMYRFEMGGIRFAHMGDVGNPLDAAQMAFLEGVDVLFALAGGYLTIRLPDLMDAIERTKPRLVVPMHFRTLTYRPRNTEWIAGFLSHFDEDTVDFACASEVSLTPDALPETTRVLVMDYARAGTPRLDMGHRMHGPGGTGRARTQQHLGG